MERQTISIQDREDIRRLFGTDLERLDQQTFKQKKKELMAKYHPDKFEKFEDETVREMATERFQLIEKLAAKIEAFYQGKSVMSADQGKGRAYMHEFAQFAAKKLKIEIITEDKDLKYHIFGSYYKWLAYGETFHIPETKASIIMDEEHQGHRIGFRETIRMYLTFDEDQAIEDIVQWLYGKVLDRASHLIISKEKVAVDPEKMAMAIKKVSFLRIEAP